MFRKEARVKSHDACKTALVSVLIPMYNAAATIDATLRSVRAQSYREIEIIVVDDGSTDGSASIVETHARADPRVRLFHQSNAGLAAARNQGAALTRGDFLAPVDADDLWHPDKISLQMQALRDGGDDVGLVYTWFAVIDADGRVVSMAHRPETQGWVLRELCRHNVVGNGSSSMIRRAAFEHCGGYEPSLRAAHAQGCEDMLIAMRIAEQYQFRVVRRHVTGYRYTPTSMSGDVLQMMRSFEQIRARYLTSHPEFAAELDAHRYDMCQWLFQRALRVGRYADAVHLYSQLAEWRGREAVTGILRIAPRLARGAVFEALKAPVRGLLKSVRQPRPFFLPELEPQ